MYKMPPMSYFHIIVTLIVHFVDDAQFPTLLCLHFM